MGALRAARRREKRQKEKAHKHHSILELYYQKGRADGRELSVFLSSLCLHNEFKWNADKIITLINQCNKEAVRYDNDGVALVFDFWEKRVCEEINKLDLQGIRKVNAIEEKTYCDARNDFFIAGFAVVCTVLSSGYGYSSNSKRTGRLDKLIAFGVGEYLNVLNGNTNIAHYISRNKKEVGLNFKEE